MVPYKAWRRQVKGKKGQILSLNWKNLSTILTKILSNMLEKLMRETLEKEFRLVKNQSSVHCYRMLKKNALHSDPYWARHVWSFREFKIRLKLEEKLRLSIFPENVCVYPGKKEKFI